MSTHTQYDTEVVMRLTDVILMILETHAESNRSEPFVGLRELFSRLKRVRALQRGDTKKVMNRALNWLVQKRSVVRKEGGSKRQPRPSFAVWDAGQSAASAAATRSRGQARRDREQCGGHARQRSNDLIDFWGW